MKPARIAVICVAAVSAIGLALVVRAMGSSSNEPASPAAAAPVEQRAMTRILVAAKEDPDGRWRMDNPYATERLLVPFDAKGEPSKWITLRALRVLRNGG